MVAVLALAVVACGGSVGETHPRTDAGSDAPVATDAGVADALEDTAAEDTTPPYPDGPYGLNAKNVFPNLKLEGHIHGSPDWVPMAMSDYYDPDGSRGITAIALDVECQWCPPSNTLADHMTVWWPYIYEPRGARIITTMVEGLDHKPATRATVDEWVKKHVTNYDIMLDPTGTSWAGLKSLSFPRQYIIDPRTMQIVRVVIGIDAAATVGCTSDANCCKTADSPDICAQDYFCAVALKSCLTKGSTGPIPGLDAVMIKNGAPPLDTGI